jgi:uncharacterized protein involved in outer membrane biogenesis
MIQFRLPAMPGRLAKSLIALGSLAGLLAGATLYVALVGISMDGSLYRRPLQNLLSEQLGRPVHLDGALDLRLSLTPALRVKELRIAQPEGFDGPDFLRIGELQVQLDLWPLMDGRFKAETLSASGVKIMLKQRADGSNSWTFPDLAESDPPRRQSAEELEAADAALQAQIAGIDIRKIELRDLDVEFRGVNDKPLFFALDKFDASLPAEGVLKATAQGSVDQTMPYAIAFEGGRLRDLVQGKSAWPLALTLDFAGGVLTATGTLSQADTQLQLKVAAPDLAQFGKIIGVALPDAGRAGIAGLVQMTPGQLRLRELSATLGKSAMTGELGIDTRGERAHLSGALTLSVLDLRPLLGQDTEEEPPTDFRALYLSLSKARLDLQQLHQYDADLSLQVDRWLSLPGDIGKASLKVKLASGQLKMPVQAMVSAVPLKGELEVDASRAVPALRVALGAENAGIGGLAQLLTGLPGIEGRLGRIRMRLASEGSNGQALMKKLAASVELQDSRLSYGNIRDGKPVSFLVERLKVELPSERALNGSFKGQLLGKPLEARLSGNDLGSIMQSGSSPVELTAQSGRVSARVAGVLDAGRNAANMQFSLGTSQAGDVAAWLGLSPEARVPLALSGKFSIEDDQWQLSEMVFQLGQSKVQAELSRTQREGKPLISGSVDALSVHLTELASMTSGATDKKTQTSSKSATTLDIPLLPRKLVLDNADLRLRARSIQGTPLPMGELGFDVHLRDGYMHSSPFFADVAGARFDGALMLDLRDEPRIQLRLGAADIEVGKLLRQLKLARDVDVRFDRFALTLDSHSAQLSGLLANAKLVGEITGGKWLLRDAQSGAKASVLIRQGKLTASPGERLRMDVGGTLDQIPVEIALSSAPVKDLLDVSRRVPFELSIAAVNTRLNLNGTMDRDIEARDLELGLKVQGERLDQLDKLLRVSLPPWGPWSASGRFRMSTRGYEVEDLQLKVGSSTLNGRGSLVTSTVRPRLDIALNAPLVQLDDFKLQNWSAIDAPSSGGASPDIVLDQESLRKAAIEKSDQVQGLLSPSTLKKIDATLLVRVERVMSGKDALGNGEIQARLKDGRADIGPVRVEMPGGSAVWSLGYEPTDRDVMARLKIDVDHFDYGVLGRRIKPDTDVDGRFSLHANVSSRAPRLSQILRHGDGKIEFIVWPKNVRAGVFDIWAVNVLTALLPTINPDNESRVNCAVARFGLDGGRMVQRDLVIDTSQMRVSGTASIDLANEKLTLRLQPQAKNAQFLSLATPIEVTGSFSKFKVGVRPGDVVETVVRLATSVVWVPVKKLFTDKVPVDGSDVCVMAEASAR